MGCCGGFFRPSNLFGGTIDFLGNVADFAKELGGALIDLHLDFVEEAFSLIGIEDETVFFVAVETQQLIPDEQDNPIQKIIFDHALNNSSIAQQLHLTNMIGVTPNMERYHAYGLSDYVYSVPSVYFVIKKQDIDAVDLVITNNIALTAVTIETFIYFRLTITDWIKWQLQDNTAYLYHTNTLTSGGKEFTYRGYTLSGTNDYIIDLRKNRETITTTYLEYVRVTTGGTETVTIQEHTKIWIDTILQSDIYTGSPVVFSTQPDQSNPDLTWDEELNSVTVNDEESHDIGFEISAITDAKLFTVVYHKDSAPADEIIWIYDRETGIYPTLNGIDPSGTDTTKTIPIVPLRQDFINVNVNRTLPKYTTAKQLLNLIGLNIDTLIEGINDSPDIDKIREAAILFGVNVYTQSQGGLHGLYNIFEMLWENQEIDKTEYDKQTNANRGNASVNRYEIQEQNINNLLQFNYVEKKTVVGVIADVGQYISVVVILPLSPVQGGGEDPDTGDELPTWGQEPRSILRYRYQTDASNYIEFSAHGLIEIVTIQALDSSYHANIFSLEDSGGDNRRNFIIPLNLAQMDGFSLDEKEAFLYESLHIVMYANSKEHLRYYETSAFANFVNVVVIVITVISLVFSGGAGNVLIELGKKLLYQYALTLALTKILEHNISPAAQVAAVAAFTYLSINNFQGESTDLITSAEELVLGINAVQEAFVLNTSIELAALQEETEEFTKLAKSRQEELQNAFDLLNPELGIDPTDLVRSIRTNTSETPENFYLRTIHTGNPGVLTLDQITNYHDNSLALPRLQRIE